MDEYFGASELPARIVPGRSCGTCTLCCKVYAVPELNKPRLKWCAHCVPGKGCGIHETRPPICRQFYCNWLLLENLGPEWKPERCKFVLHSVYYPAGHQGLSIDVDPGYPDAWRREPFYTHIKEWAVKASERTTGPVYFIMVQVGYQKFAVLPDRDLALGNVADDEQIEVARQVVGNRAHLTFKKRVVKEGQAGVSV